MHCQRFELEPAALAADNNIRHQYPIHKGKWIGHPDITPFEASFCRYTLAFALDAPATLELHVSADHRFELTCDGQYLGMGPDRSDIEHWSFHSYRLTLDRGTHELTADVHYLGLHSPLRPCAQTCIEPGFVLYTEDAPVDLSTGAAPWKVTRLKGVGIHRAPLKSYFVVGPNYTFDAREFFNPDAPVEPVVVRNAGANGGAGRVEPGWKLYPSRLPEQLRQPVAGGCVRSVTDIGDDDPFPADDAAPHPQWQALIEGNAPLTVPPSTRVTALWDLDQYHCAYPELTTTGGAGSRITIEWAESCYNSANDTEGTPDGRRKGDRNAITGKYFRGYGDTFCPDGPQRTFRPYWWRAGRYVRIVVQTQAEPVTLDRLQLLETRMPLDNESRFASSDGDLAPIIDVAARGIQMCAHETYMDCPYYEQMMYVGDTRLQFLTAYTMSSEDRLNQRALEIFDWSRMEKGFVLERCPSQPKQLSCTFAMVWLLMLRDFAWWRDDADFLRQRLKGMRCLLEEFKALPADHDPLLPPLPGWSFMDWVEGMSFVNPPGPGASISAVVNLLFLNALNAAAEVEAAHGEPHLADYNRAWAARLAKAIDQRFWDETRGLFADDPDHQQYSEHAQCLALLSGLFPQRDERCFESLITADDLLRTTVYFSFYLLDTFAKFGRGDLIQQKFEFWKEMVAIGMKTPMEMPEPSRSDCHAWGSHPLFHMHASLAGIRPAAPGFAEVTITPSPGSLTEIASTIPHPAGTVSLSMNRSGDTWQVEAILPDGVPGSLHWRGKTHPLQDTTRLTLPASA